LSFEVYRLQLHARDLPKFIGQHRPHLRKLLAPPRLQYPHMQHAVLVEAQHLRAFRQHRSAGDDPRRRQPVFLRESA
jgi:hypothetical protein